jgi:hypothetical protein
MKMVYSLYSVLLVVDVTLRCFLAANSRTDIASSGLVYFIVLEYA